jgi:hypothetical protein
MAQLAEMPDARGGHGADQTGIAGRDIGLADMFVERFIKGQVAGQDIDQHERCDTPRGKAGGMGVIAPDGLCGFGRRVVGMGRKV